MTIELNGERVEIASGARVGDAVARSGADPERRGVAVAVDGEVVPRSAWDRTELREGQRVEVVGAIQGG
jgi:sulfur carrier protein